MGEIINSKIKIQNSKIDGGLNNYLKSTTSTPGYFLASKTKVSSVIAVFVFILLML
jgi:hypothetical protein